MATLPGRIRRISLDGGNPANYTLRSTAAYNALLPADSPSAMSATDVATLDQEFSAPTPPALLVTQKGTLVSFARLPEYCDGVIVKVRPTYSTGGGEDPYLEFWTYKTGTDSGWTLRRSVQLRNGFEGCPSGSVKYFDFRTAAGLLHVTDMWITLNPGSVGTPTLEFMAIHCFGRCRNVPVTDGNCEHDPTIDCLPMDPCFLDPESCLTGVEDCTDLDPAVCDIPTPNWPTLPPPAGGPTPKFTPPEFPLIDLCDAAALAAYKESLTPEQLTFFTELLNNMELPCLVPLEVPPVRQPDPVAPINEAPGGGKVLPKQPIELYVDPQTLAPKDDPRAGGGHGGTSSGLKTKRYIFTWSENDAVEALALVNANVAALYGYTSPSQIVQGHWGPAAGVSTLGVQFTPAAYGLRLTLTGLPPLAQVGLRMQTLKLRGAVNLQDSINNSGVYVSPTGGGRCVLGPDWVLSPGNSLTVASTPMILHSFYEFFHQNLLEFNTENANHIGTQGVNAEFRLTVPRTVPTQNDAVPCTGSYVARSRMGFQRGGYLNLSASPQAKEHSIWLADTSAEDIDGDPTNTYYASYLLPMVLVLDVAVTQLVFGDEIFATSGVASSLATTGLTATQAVEVPD